MAKSLIEEYIIRLTGEEDPSAKQVIKSLMTGKQAAEQTGDAFKELTKVVGNFSQTVGSLSNNPGFNSLVSFLTSDSFKRMTAVAALGAVTTAIYKFAASATKAEFELERMAKAQRKSVDTVRAQNEALSAMGKSLDEIKKDKGLKAIYEDIKKTNEEMALPNLTASLERVRGLQGAFWKLRSTVSYAIQWINAKYLANMDNILKKITDKLNDIQSWAKTNMGTITDKVSTLFTDLSKGVYTIFEGFFKVGEIVNSLPDGVKAVGVAIAGVIAYFKAGPIGQLLSLITLIGDIRHDYDNWQWNKEHPDEEQIPIAFSGIYEVWDDKKMDPADKVKNTLDLLFGSLSDGIKKWADDLKNTNGLGGLLDGETGIIGTIIGAIGDWISSPEGQKVVSETIRSALDLAIQSATLIGDVTSDIAGLIARAMGAKNLADALEGKLGDENGVIDSALSSVVTGRIITLITGNSQAGFIGGIVSGIMTLIGSARKDALRKIAKEKGFTDAEIGRRGGDAWLDKQFGNDPKLLEYMGGDIGKDAVNTVKLLFNEVIVKGIELIGDGVDIVGDLSEKALGYILKAFGMDELGKKLENDTTLDGVLGGAALGLLVRAVTGSDKAGIIAGLAGAIFDTYKDARKAALKKLEKEDTNKNTMNLDQLEEAYANDPRLWTEILGNAGEQVIGTLSVIWEGLVKAVVAASDFGSSMINTLISAIFDSLQEKPSGSTKDVKDTVASNIQNVLTELVGDDVYEGILTGIGTWIGTGNLGVGILTGLLNTVIQSIDKINTDDDELWNDDLYGVLKKTWETFSAKIETLWLGAMDDNGNRKSETGLKSVVKKLLFGDDKTDYGSDIIAVIDETRNDVIKRQKKGGLLNWLLGYDADVTRGDTKIGTEHVKGALETAFEEIVGKLEEANGFLSKLWAPVHNWLVTTVIPGVVTELKNLLGESGEISGLLSTLGTTLSDWWDETGKPLIDNIAKYIYATLYNSLPPEARRLLGGVLGNPNSASEVVHNEDGSVTISSSQGGSRTFAAGEYDPEAIKILEQSSALFSFDSNGNAFGLHGDPGGNIGVSNVFSEAIEEILRTGQRPHAGTPFGALGNGAQFKDWDDFAQAYGLISLIDRLKKQEPSQEQKPTQKTEPFESSEGTLLTDEYKEKYWKTPDPLVPGKKRKKTAPTDEESSESGRNGASRFPTDIHDYIVGFAGGSTESRGSNGRYDNENGVYYNPGIADNVILSKVYNTDNDAGKNVIATVEQLKQFQQAVSESAKKLVTDTNTLSDRVNILIGTVDNASAYLITYSGSVSSATEVLDVFSDYVANTLQGTVLNNLVVYISGDFTTALKDLATYVSGDFTTSLSDLATYVSGDFTTSLSDFATYVSGTLTETFTSFNTAVGEGTSALSGEGGLSIAAGELSTLLKGDVTTALTGLKGEAESASGALNTLSVTYVAPLNTALGGATGGLDALKGAATSLQGKFNDFKMPTISVTGITDAFKGATTAVNTFASAAKRAADRLDGKVEKNAQGGRIDHDIISHIGEDGTEYVIPITKPNRAFPLINQMLMEMGSSAIDRIAGDFGLGTAGTVGYNMASMQAAAQNISQNNTYNISAPVNITVNGTGSAESIGSAVYDTAERHLLKTLKGVYA